MLTSGWLFPSTNDSSTGTEGRVQMRSPSSQQKLLTEQFLLGKFYFALSITLASLSKPRSSSAVGGPNENLAYPP